MKNSGRRSPWLYAVLVPSLVAVVAIAERNSAQGAPWRVPDPPVLPSQDVPLSVDTGLIENTGEVPDVIFSTVVEVPGAQWLRLWFESVLLAGERAEGTDSFLIIRSLEDGDTAEMDRTDLEYWRNSTPYFNGDRVTVELFAHPMTGPNRLVIDHATAGLGGGGRSE